MMWQVSRHHQAQLISEYFLELWRPLLFYPQIGITIRAPAWLKSLYRLAVEICLKIGLVPLTIYFDSFQHTSGLSRVKAVTLLTWVCTVHWSLHGRGEVAYLNTICPWWSWERKWISAWFIWHCAWIRSCPFILTGFLFVLWKGVSMTTFAMTRM